MFELSECSLNDPSLMDKLSKVNVPRNDPNVKQYFNRYPRYIYMFKHSECSVNNPRVRQGEVLYRCRFNQPVTKEVNSIGLTDWVTVFAGDMGEWEP